MKSFLVVICLSFSVLALADQIKDLNNKAYWICQHRKDVRTIRVYVGKDNQCHTLYSKLGKERSVGSGRYVSSCVGFLNNVKTNLEKSGWKCRDITGSTISVSQD